MSLAAQVFERLWGTPGSDIESMNAITVLVCYAVLCWRERSKCLKSVEGMPSSSFVFSSGFGRLNWTRSQICKTKTSCRNICTPQLPALTCFWLSSFRLQFALRVLHSGSDAGVRYAASGRVSSTDLVNILLRTLFAGDTALADLPDELFDQDKSPGPALAPQWALDGKGAPFAVSQPVVTHVLWPSALQQSGIEQCNQSGIIVHTGCRTWFFHET